MSRDLEERVASLEKEMKAIKELVARRYTNNDWECTFGAFANDPGFEEMVRLGREIREQERKDELES